MKTVSITELLQKNSYPGRGILIGKSADGRQAVAAYFIMGRSENSRNRIFVKEGDGIRTQAYDPSKLVDPSLIIYAPVRVLENRLIVTNGDQTDTIYDTIKSGGTFAAALRTREFEPDGPNWTPRISGMLTFGQGDFSYALSILKSANGNGASCERFFYEYAQPVAGEGRFLHTYRCDGDPIPSFEGEPIPIMVGNDIDGFACSLWESLNQANKVSLFVRMVSLKDGTMQTRIFNKNEMGC